ncbi:DHHA1 domain-containing protein [Clostridium estertheticum]|uniref:alanyl-tRNA editing protein n=1 Tax=Clostridium estertheticum TaxID=238834 RepID=UPI001C0C45B8|nr:DHHA1 domain-containing protein [Clostridium estertheticum]MBU3199712.1 alanyl-tRNA editing protein AlaX-L [Clostridium estertheticum]WAG67631.1 DHHA1 domain-containing protein [Clostridium estertheticum]
MEKLYYEDQYKTEFTAEIVDIIKKENKYHVELNGTYFHPKGTGQPSDTGHINGSLVISVYEENNKIYHVLEVKPLKIHKVKCKINFDLRYDYMQQHLGQHILTTCISNLFNLTTIDFHLGLTSSTIALDKAIGLDELRACEKKANDIVFENIKVEVLYLTNPELKKLSLKKIPVKSGEKVRIIKIGDIDVNPSQDLYPNSTIEVQIIKIIKFEKYKAGIRIEFICGQRAVSDYILKFEAIEKMSKLLSCNNDTVISKVETLTGELNKALTTSRVLSATVATYEVQNMLKEAEKIDDVRILKFIYDKMDLKYATMLATKLVTSPKVIVLFGVKLQDKANLLFMCSKDLKIIRMDSLLKDAITLIDGKGGGSEFSAQGGGKNNNNLDSTLDYALSKIKENIISCSKN